MSDDQVFDAAQEALNRMARAHRRGTGCHLTAEMIQSLGLTVVGQMWNEDDPRDMDAEDRADAKELGR